MANKPPSGKAQSSSSASNAKRSPSSDNDRRSFVVRMAAGVIGAIVAVVPLFAGLRTYIDPLTRRPKKPGGEKAEPETATDDLIRVATLEAMPEVGKVYRFPVITTRVDKWTLYPPGPIGAVFLRRTSDDPNAKPVAFTSVCPHLGCSVDFKGDQYKCPCHNSTWTVTGERINPESCPSPRDLDTLDVDVRNGAVYVDYKRFRGGVADKIEE